MQSKQCPPLEGNAKGVQMPAGSPTPDHIIGRKVTFFSIDTNVMEGKGFDFKRGALNVLHLQRPTWITLQLSEIVEREVFAHRMSDLMDAKKKLDSALNHMRRKASLDVSKLESAADSLAIVESAQQQFKTEIQIFVSGLSGKVLATHGETLARDLFDRYFAMQPPFEVIKDKKSEFPDAAALLVLEQHAKDLSTNGVLVSNDKGWHSFANNSDHLFCVKTLEEFTGLFEAMSEHAKLLLSKIRADLEDDNSNCHALVKDAVQEHVSEAEWSVDEICTGFSHRQEAESYEACVVAFEPDFKNIQGWFTDEDSPLFVVEVPVSISVEVLISVAFFQWDSIDHEEIPMGSQEIAVPMDVDVSVFLTSSGELMALPVADWDIEVEIATGSYSVDAGEVNLDYGYDEEYDPDQHDSQDQKSGVVSKNFDDITQP